MHNLFSRGHNLHNLHAETIGARMHSMSDSATLSRAAQRKQATATRLTSACRRLTESRGLSGFTIEEACEEVGVSRRTFFNYFPSKEEAILGVDEAEEMREISEQFLARGSRGWAAVVDDLVDIASEHVSASGVDAEEHLALMRAVEREPRLLARFIGMGRSREAELTALVARREGVGADDIHARVCVEILTVVMRSAGSRLHDPRVSEDFGGAISNSLAAVRAVLAPSPRKANQ